MPSTSFRDLLSEEEAAEYDRRLDAALQPLIDLYNEENERIPKLRQELTAARERRDALAREIRKRNPDAVAPARVAPKPRTKPGLTKSEAHKRLLTELTDWLQTHKSELNANGGFRSVDLDSRSDFTMIRTNPDRYLSELHALGVLHLDRHVKGPSLGDRKAGKFYRVV
jgi:hypothetical protein